MNLSLRLSGQQHAELHRHLFPGDGCEAVAIILCGRRNGRCHILTAYKLHLVPHHACTERTRDRVRWETRLIDEAMEEAAAEGLAIVKIHSHPTGYHDFSKADDDSDRRLFPTFYHLLDDGLPHASAVMLPDGQMFGRQVTAEGKFYPLSRISVAGDEIRIWDLGRDNSPIPAHALRNAQAFGEGTTRDIQGLTVGIVGLSGLGGPMVEQLARYGPRKLVFVDPETVEEPNRNRIPGSKPSDVGRLKVLVQERVVAEMGMGTEVVSLAVDLADPRAMLALAECDVIFGCMDGTSGRHLLNRLCSAYLIPYFDLGVRLVADGLGGVSHVCGTVHYLQPDRSSLLSRGLYTMEDVEADALKRSDPAEFEGLLAEKYIRGVQEGRPAVVSLNTLIASFAALELIARLNPYRLEPNSQFAVNEVLVSAGIWNPQPEGPRCWVVTRLAGRGDMDPLLDMTIFTFWREAA